MVAITVVMMVIITAMIGKKQDHDYHLSYNNHE